MASVNEVYGNNFAERAQIDKAIYVGKLCGTNIAHKQFNFRNDNSAMWVGGRLRPEALQSLIETVKTVNPNMRLVYADKTTSAINRFPYLINGLVEYFNAIELKEGQIYSLYITASQMEVF